MAIRYHRNIDGLGTDALHDLLEALATRFTVPAADEHSFATLGRLRVGCTGHPATSAETVRPAS